MGYQVDQKSHIQSELTLSMPRLTAFAAALTGNEAASLSLVKATRNQAMARTKERGHTPLLLWTFSLMHTLWAARAKAQGQDNAAGDPRIFAPRAFHGGDKSAAARMAKFVAQLSPQQRGALHLVYGERLSYDEVAEIFSVPVATVMTRLARCHAAVSDIEGQSGFSPLAAGPIAARAKQAEPRAREWAA